MKIAIGADHTGFELKNALIPFIENELKIDVIDDGAYEFEQSDDYPDFVIPVARTVSENHQEIRGIIIGYSGQGEAVSANRFPHVRAVVYYGEGKPLKNVSKAGDDVGIIEASRTDNDSNILSIAAGFVDIEGAKSAVKKWLGTSFSGAERHVRRISKIECHIPYKESSKSQEN